MQVSLIVGKNDISEFIHYVCLGKCPLEQAADLCEKAILIDIDRHIPKIVVILDIIDPPETGERIIIINAPLFPLEWKGVAFGKLHSQLRI